LLKKMPTTIYWWQLWVSWKSERCSHIFLRDVNEFPSVPYTFTVPPECKQYKRSEHNTVEYLWVSWISGREGHSTLPMGVMKSCVAWSRKCLERKERLGNVCVPRHGLQYLPSWVCSEQSKCELGLDLVTLCLRIWHANPWAEPKLIFGLSVYII
jgi:hypothetical protein